MNDSRLVVVVSTLTPKSLRPSYIIHVFPTTNAKRRIILYIKQNIYFLPANMLLLNGNHNSLQITILIYQQKYEIMKYVHHNRPFVWWYTLHRFTGGSHHKYQSCGIFILSLLIMMTSSNGNIFRVTGLCGGNSPITGELLPSRPVARTFDVFVDLYWLLLQLCLRIKAKRRTLFVYLLWNARFKCWTGSYSSC